MLKKIVLSLIVMGLVVMSAFSAELYGFIESFEANFYEDQYICLDQGKAIRDGNGNLIKGIEKLSLPNAYSDTVFNALLSAGEKGWCVRFTVDSLSDGVMIEKVKTPYKITPVPVVGLIAEYLFENSADDSSGNLNHGVEYNGMAYTQGFMGQAASFDGIDDFIEIIPQSNVSAIGDFTISVWTYVTGWLSATSRQYIFDGHTHSKSVTSNFYRQGFGLIYDKNSGNEEIHNFINYNDGGYMEQNTRCAVGNKWVHLVLIRRGTQDFTYVDGALLNATYSRNLKQDTVLNMQHDWYIGCFSGNNPNYGSNIATQYKYQGLLDNMRIYKRALSEAEIKVLYGEMQ